MSKDLKRLLDDVRRQGFDVRLTGGGHWLVTAPDGQTASVSSTPGAGPRVLANTRAALRRIGARL